MRAILIVYVYKLVQLVSIIFGLSYFVGIIWHIIVKDFIPWENVPYTDVFHEHITFYTYEDYGMQI